MSFLENLEASMMQDELPFEQDRLSLENIKRYNEKNSLYPEPWHRQTPKGYDPALNLKPSCNCKCSCKPSVNDLLESQTSFEE